MLNRNEINFYYKNGYVILDNKLDNKTLSNLKKSTKLLIEEYKKNKSSFIKNKKETFQNMEKCFWLIDVKIILYWKVSLRVA